MSQARIVNTRTNILSIGNPRTVSGHSTPGVNSYSDVILVRAVRPGRSIVSNSAQMFKRGVKMLTEI